MDQSLLYVNPILFWIVVIFLIVRFVRRMPSYNVWEREEFIKAYVMPDKVSRVLKEKHPHLSDENITQVIDALKHYFLICNGNATKSISMPSRVVDDAWHEFILFTSLYQSFCNKGLKRFLHHTPAEAMTSKLVTWVKPHPL
ncbi:glycine-rich domain-containing protein [Pseudomonadota bacterium]